MDEISVEAEIHSQEPVPSEKTKSPGRDGQSRSSSKKSNRRHRQGKHGHSKNLFSSEESSFSSYSTSTRSQSASSSRPASRSRSKTRSGTYFSENALLPGLVQGEFHGDTHAHRYLQSLEEEAETHPDDMPYAWILSHFMQIGLDTYSHNFTLCYPMADKVFKGTNVYGILRATRGSSTESLVVSVPYRPPTSLHHGTSSSIALMLALAEFFSEQVYWAKDIIFLVTEHEQLGAQAWLEAYHQSSCGSGSLISGELPARAGPIQAAVNLEIGTSFVSHIDVKIEGLNGQLPNLDLVNLIHRLCHRESVHHTFKNTDDHPHPETFNGWIHQLKTLLSMVGTQATGIPNGNHGLFHRYGIAAVTLEGAKEDMRTKRSSNLNQLGRVLEGICRSLNNLLERFHQSFFFYLLPATNRYVSIGVYMPPFGFLGGSLLAVALALWYTTSCSANLQEKSSEVNQPEMDNKKEENLKISMIDYSLMGKAPIIIMIHCLGITLSMCPTYLASFGKLIDLQPEDSVCLGLLAFTISSLTLPICISRIYDLSRSSWEVMKCLIVLELSVIVFAGAVYNFSLALIVTVVYAPIAMATAPSTYIWKRLLRCFFLIIAHPLMLLFLFVSLDTYLNFKDLSSSVILIKAALATKRSLMYAIVDSHVYGNWAFDVACTCLVPIWMSMWVIACHPIPKDVTTTVDEVTKAKRSKNKKIKSS